MPKPDLNDLFGVGDFGPGGAFDDMFSAGSRATTSDTTNTITQLRLEVVKHVNEKQELKERLNAALQANKVLNDRLTKSQQQTVLLSEKVSFQDGVIQSQTIIIEQFSSSSK